jgi:hypothetical protein
VHMALPVLIVFCTFFAMVAAVDKAGHAGN